MDKFNRENLTGLRNLIEDALKSVSTKLNVQFKLGNIRYSADTATCKLTCTTATAITPTLAPKDNKVEFEFFCRAFGLAPEDYEKIFPYKRNTYQIVGINPRAKGYPILVKRIPGGKQFKMPKELVLIALKKPTSNNMLNV